MELFLIQEAPSLLYGVISHPSIRLADIPGYYNPRNLLWKKTWYHDYAQTKVVIKGS